ncbi:hypothetical protein Sru01_56550 [Sphaerisporangium rufum]|uniref:DNA methylase adenine-specific domain-containing protein n=1 Tax=Sphaerisporangium rufum TaxID=1381558 RepID=A0A919R7H4_9ACTN|nr:N-6 DNA methylase [Sphaerisporangium rufum]GII80673.1 hypothetical protein Sru01_56550 [Sphaerisporangium rufum]
MTLVSLTEIARRAGVGPGAVSNWRRRHRDSFPEPVSLEGREQFRADEVASWLDGRRIDRASLRPDEAGGRTYGDRFRATYGDQLRATGGSAGHPGYTAQMRDLLTRLLRLPSFQIPNSDPDVLLELLVLRLRDENGWTALKERDREVTAYPDIREFLGRRGSEFEHIGPKAIRSQVSHDLLAGLDTLIPPTDDSGWSALVAAFTDVAAEWLVKSVEHYTPRSLVELISAVTSPAPDDEVCDPCCGNGGLLAGIAGVTRKAVRGHALWERSARTASLTLALRGRKGEITPDAAPSPDGVRRRYQVVVTNPPFNLHAKEGPWRGRFGTIPAKSINTAWLCDIYERLADDGRGAVIMPNGSSFSQGAERDIRAAMVRAGVIERIIALPPGLFVTTAIPVTLWVLRKTGPQSVLLVDGTDLGNMVGRSRRELSGPEIRLLASMAPGERSRLARLPEIEEHDYDLSPARYISRMSVSQDDSTFADHLRDLALAERAVEIADAHAREQLKRISEWRR